MFLKSFREAVVVLVLIILVIFFPIPSSSSSSSSSSGSCRRSTSAASERSKGPELGHSGCVLLMSNGTPHPFAKAGAPDEMLATCSNPVINFEYGECVAFWVLAKSQPTASIWKGVLVHK